MMIQTEFGTDIAACKEASWSALSTDVVANNMVMSAMDGHHPLNGAFHYALVRSSNTGQLLGVIAQTLAQRPLLSKMPSGIATQAVEAWFSKMGPSITLFGPAATIKEAEPVFCLLHKGKTVRTKILLSYQLSSVQVSSASSIGTIRFPGQNGNTSPSDMDRINNWSIAFAKECDLPESRSPTLAKDLEARTHRLLSNQSIALWEIDGQAVAMAAAVRRSSFAAAVGLVYTPKEFRGRGFAGDLVAKLSQILLDAGHPCCLLFTDPSNPTSNAIYQRIGYERREDFMLLEAQASTG
jgi:GNAT superfamily N-acetyltransferase